MIEVLSNVPKTPLPKVMLVPDFVENETLPKSWVGIPQMPFEDPFETISPIVNDVAVLMLPVGEPLAVGVPMSAKP